MERDVKHVQQDLDFSVFYPFKVAWVAGQCLETDEGHLAVGLVPCESHKELLQIRA